MTTRAAILCTDPVFHRFLNEEKIKPDWQWMAVSDEQGAADLVRYICGVQSRKELIPGTSAGDKWDKLYSQFIGWRDAA